jgi:hypothetical protein
MSRSSVILTGLVGLVGTIILTAGCLFIMTSGWIRPFLNEAIHVWGLFLFLLFFSVAEIPVMVFGMRRMAASTNPKAKYMVLLANVGYTFFAGLYAVPFILLAGKSWLELAAGALMAALSLIRLSSAVIFLPNAKQL